MKKTAYICTTFENLKKFVELVSETPWDLLSQKSRMQVTAAYITYGETTTVCVENGGLTFFDIGTRQDVEYKFFRPNSDEPITRLKKRADERSDNE